MRRLFISLISMLLLVVNTNYVYAFEDEDLQPYLNIINEVNNQYNAQIYLYQEEEFNNLPVAELYEHNYQNYIQYIKNIELSVFKDNIISMATNNLNDLEVKLDNQYRSTSARKTVKFNSDRNSMTLTYKFSGAKFDTSYKPTAVVNKLSDTDYFVMTSYTGSFKNSNTTYSVLAKGKIYYRFGIADGKSFTVNFNI